MVEGVPASQHHHIKIANAAKADYAGENAKMLWSKLWSWLSRQPRGKPVQVVVYTRQGCHLCDEAWQMLQEMQRRFTLRLEKVDVDSAADLRQLYGERVPVLVVNGKERMWGRINRVLLERQVRAEARPCSG
jgi:glutaredoxin